MDSLFSSCCISFSSHTQSPPPPPLPWCDGVLIAINMSHKPTFSLFFFPFPGKIIITGELRVCQHVVIPILLPRVAFVCRCVCEGLGQPSHSLQDLGGRAVFWTADKSGFKLQDKLQPDGNEEQLQLLKDDSGFRSSKAKQNLSGESSPALRCSGFHSELFTEPSESTIWKERWYAFWSLYASAGSVWNQYLHRGAFDDSAFFIFLTAKKKESLKSN